MAAKILKGEAQASIPYEIITESFLYINSTVMAELGLILRPIWLQG